MPSYWVMRTDSSGPAFFMQELREGRLRQGWGYDDSQDLNRIAEDLGAGKELTSDQKSCWRGNRRLLATQSDGIRTGDIVLLPNLPSRGKWSVARITSDKYSFAIAAEYKDYGHIRYGTLLEEQEGLNPYSEPVSGRLRGTMRCSSRLWNIDHLASEVETILRAPRETLSEPATLLERLTRVRQEVQERLHESLMVAFRGAEFEDPVKRVLENLYDRVEAKGGRNEKGADLVCTSTDGLGLTRSVVVQVKLWEGQGDLGEALMQVEQAFDSYPGVAGGVVLTTLPLIEPSDLDRAREIESRHGLPVRLLAFPEVADLFLRYLPDTSASEA